MNALMRVVVFTLLLIGATGCTVNPVTGERELTFVGTAEEIRMGEQSYLPMRQSQGGEYDIDPRLTAYVQDIGQRLAAVSDRELPYEFTVLNNSVPNAWALPGGKIAINRGLLTELGSEAELAAVLGHEIVHAAARHSARRMEQGMLLQGLVLATAVATSDSDYGNFAIGGANLGAQLLTQRYSRSAELEADRYGMEYMARAGYDPQGAVSLQETFLRLSEGGRSDWLSGLFASHPPSRARLDTNRQTAASLPAGGDLGVQAFQAALAETRAAAPAYQAYDEGRKALAEKNIALALQKAEEAIQRFPREANFYALRGDARLLDSKPDVAIRNYDSAINRRADFFYYYLQRGRVRNQTGQYDAAKVDLERSLEFLPTASAHMMLGEIAARQGDRDAAIAHYRVVADGSGDAAEAAQASLVRLDIDRNPGDYVQRRCDPDEAGNLVVTVRNATSLPLSDIVVVIEYGRSNRLERRIGDTLAPGGTARINTGLGPFPAGSNCPATITAAAIAE